MISNYYTSGYKQKTDFHIVLFFLNVLLVIVSYRSVSWGIFDLVKAIRLALIIISLLYLFLSKKTDDYKLLKQKSTLVLGFLFINLLVLPFSGSFNNSISRYLVFVPFIIYLNYFVVYLFSTYEKDEIKRKIIPVFCFIYFLPIINYLVTGETENVSNLYGNENTGFRSNTYGWSSAFFLVTAFDYITNNKVNKLKILFVILAMGLASYVLIISGSRSSYLCIAATLVLLLFSNKSVHVIFKLIGVAAIVSTTFYFLSDEKSALSNRLEKTENQLESGDESRLEMATLALGVVMKDGNAFFHGLGFDNTEDAIYEFTGIELNKALHNSYLQIFIEGGIIIFTYFFLVFVCFPVWRYMRYDAKRFLFFPTLIIISFFESNYGAGQFLFFPWMFFMIYYIHYGGEQVTHSEYLELLEAQKK